MSVRFILFDAFGTLLRIPQGRHPYRMILKEGIRQGRRPQPNDLHQVMTRSLSLAEAAELFGISIRPDLMAEIQDALDADLNSIEPFDDGLRAVEMLQSEGIKIAVASNLAAPYGEPVCRLYPTLDGYGFSYAIGAMKPEPFMYRASCELLGADTSEYFSDNQVMMIGDSIQRDCYAPREVGIQGFFLNRRGGEGFKSLTDFADHVLATNSGLAS
ncbi:MULTISPECIES: HAD family hydrolase [unclassified Pseudomonas]|uniref:HAD family hydrolase n=1 Tax=unclassified Pseudomonas TaxID=196821 RepID=UPI00380EACFE